MDEQIAWLRQQFDDDERVARAATVLPYGSFEWFSGAEGSVLGIDPGSEMHVRGAVLSLDDIGEHIARWDPARVLAEIEAKRAILDEIFRYEAKIDGEWGCSHDATAIESGKCPDTRPGEIRAVRLMAQPYAERDGFPEEWRADGGS